MSALKDIVASLFGSRKRLWLPFLVTALVEAFLILLLWLAPQPPWSTVFAPPIRYFFGDRVLHYPWHLWFLYYAMKHTYVMASLLAGAFMSGLACAMVVQQHEGQSISLRDAVHSHRFRYRTVVWIWLCIWLMGKVLGEGLGRAPLHPPIAAFWIGVTATIVLQALLAYAIPLAVFQRVGWVKAMAGSLRETARYPFSTAMVILVPSALVIAFSVLAHPNLVLQWLKDTCPELALAFVAGRLVLWTTADALLTIGIASLWWAHHAGETVDAQPIVMPNPQEGSARA